jgi:hypothetical protein
MNQAQLIKSSKLIAQRMGIDQGAALNMLQKKLGEEDPREKNARDKYGVPDYTKINNEAEKENIKFETNSRIISEAKGIPIEEAKSLLKQRIEQYAAEAKPAVDPEIKNIVEQSKYYDSDNKSLTQNIGDYVVETVKHPIDRAGQIAVEAVNTFPSLYDTATMLGSQIVDIGSTDTPGGRAATATAHQRGEKAGEPTEVSRKVKKFLSQNLKNYAGLNPAENKFAEGANSVVSTVPEMLLFGGAGTALNKAAKGVKQLGNNKAAEIGSKVLEGAGNFLKGGSDIKKATDVGSTVGSVALPTALGIDSLPVNLALGYVGSRAGHNIGKNVARFNKQSRNLKEVMANDPTNPEYTSEGQKITDRFAEQGMTALPLNITDNKGFRALGKGAETSIFGKNIAEALEGQRKQISEKITPIHDKDFSSSFLGEEAADAYKKNTQKLIDSFAEDFEKTKKSVRTHTDQIVPLKRTQEFMKNMFEDLTAHPEHVGMKLNSPAGKFLNKIAAKGIRENIKAILRGKKEAPFLTQEQKVELAEIMKEHNRPQTKVTDKSGKVIENIDPVLEELIRKKIGGSDLSTNPFFEPYMELEYPFLKDAMQELRESTPKAGQFSDAKGGALKNLTEHLWEDIDNSVGQQMKAKSPAEYEFFRNTHQEYADFATKERKDRNALLANTDSPVQFINQIVNDGVRRDGKKVSFITDGMTPEAHKSFVDKINKMFGSAGMKNNKEFDPAIWRERFNSLDDQSKVAIYGDKVDEFKKLSAVVQDMEKVHQFKNTSGTSIQGLAAVDASLLYNAAKGLLLGAWTMSPKQIAGGIAPVFAKIAGNRMLTNEGVGKFMLKLQNAKTRREVIDSLNGYGKHTKSVAVKSLIKNLQKVINLGERSGDVKRKD